MQTFQQFYEQKQAIAPVIKIDIAGIGQFSAKADTGNDGYNVLHATDIKSDGSSVTFVTNGKSHAAQLQGSLKVNKGPQLQEDRYVVNFNIAVGGKLYKDQPFTISDRTGMSEPVLLSKDFIQQMNKVVDPALE